MSPADAFDEAGAHATLWEKISKPLFAATASPAKYCVAQGPRSGIATILGDGPAMRTTTRSPNTNLDT